MNHKWAKNGHSENIIFIVKLRYGDRHSPTQDFSSLHQHKTTLLTSYLHAITQIQQIPRKRYILIPTYEEKSAKSIWSHNNLSKMKHAKLFYRLLHDIICKHRSLHSIDSNISQKHEKIITELIQQNEHNN